MSKKVEETYVTINEVVHKPCIDCKIFLPLGQFNPRYGKGPGSKKPTSFCKKCGSKRWMKWRNKYHQKRLDWQNQDRRKKRQIVLDHYGGKCKCCGEKNREFLAIDHSNGDGAAHRRLIGKINMDLWLLRNGFPKEGFRILCHNCNMSMGNFGYCPHNKDFK